jgi:hypothetical protein
MSHALRTAATMLASSALLLVVSACHRADKAAVKDENSPPVQSAVMPKAQYGRSPCEWITRAEAEKILGEPLISDPVRVSSAENAVPRADGDGCAYEMKQTSQFAKSVVAIEMTIDDAGEMQAGFSSGGATLAGAAAAVGLAPVVQNVFKGKESKGDSLVNRRWDYLSNLPGGVTMAREGRVVAQVFAYGQGDKGIKMAEAIMDKIADVPFAKDPADLTAPATDPDPCSLITRQEAEAVLGPLTTAPYRSRESSALAYADGTSCSYFSGKHRALVVTPTYSNGATQYKMMAGVGNMVSSVLGGAKAPDTLEGKWDQISTSPTNSLVFLKGDKMVDMQFKSSSTDYDGAVKLAHAAAGRL